MVDYQRLIDDISIDNLPFDAQVGLFYGKLIIILWVNNRNNPDEVMEVSFFRPLLDTDDEDEAIEYVYWNLQESLLHEMAECFLVGGERVFDPHNPDNKGIIMGPPDMSWLDRAKSPDKVQRKRS